MPRAPLSKRNTFGELYALLERIFPKHRSSRDGVLDIPQLAEELEMTPEGVYKWLRADKLPPKKARKLVEMANAGLKEKDHVTDLNDFLTFLD